MPIGKNKHDFAGESSWHDIYGSALANGGHFGCRRIVMAVAAAKCTAVAAWVVCYRARYHFVSGFGFLFL